MIQRIQSIYLAVIILIIATLCAINIIYVISVDETGYATEYGLNLFYFTIKQNNTLIETQLQYGFIALAALIIGLALSALFGFKDRKKQMLYCKINFVALIALIAAFFAKTYTSIPNFSGDKLMIGSIIGIALLLFTVYLNWRAFALIKKDDNLVKSADRIR